MSASPKAEAPERQSDRKRRAIIGAATAVFLEKGFDGATMDEVAALASVSKPTVYKHFSDKNRLYAEVVRETVERVEPLVAVIARSFTDADDLGQALYILGRELLKSLTDPTTIALRRLVIANAERFPDVARDWYDSGFGQVLGTLAGSFSSLARNRSLSVSNPTQAAEHFAGLLLWIPLNKGMFGRDSELNASAIDATARAAADTFLRAYAIAE